jgi:hypothetical protein
MNSLGKLVVKMGVLSLLSALPLAAQIDNAVTFTAPFPFYAGNVKLPAGSYTLTEPDMNTKVVLIRNSAGTKGDFINFIPTSSEHAQGDTDVTFHKDGDTGYLEGLSIAGETDGLEFEQTKAEAKAETAADNTTVVEHATLVGGE